MDLVKLKEQIKVSRINALGFIDNLKINNGYKYTVNHNPEEHQSAVLYGSWSAAYLKRLLLGKLWENKDEKSFLRNSLLKHRQKDGTFFPNQLMGLKPSKSYEYLRLHCSNYAIGALLEIDNDFDFQSDYFDAYLNPDFLTRWLDQRAFNRPWEESNNIVNVASYLQVSHRMGVSSAGERLYQMLEWHNKYQNPITGGFDNFSSRNYKSVLESMAGGVHNFHLHLYLGEPINHEKLIAGNVIPYLFEGPLSACLSIDFVELAIRTLEFSENKQATISALLFHLDALLNYQNADGGWYEKENSNVPTSAAGMREYKASSCSYATWFRLCSIGMISISLLDDLPENWSFRKSLGMGYAPEKWPSIEKGEKIIIDKKIHNYYKKKNIPRKLKKKIITLGGKVLG